MRPLLLAGFAAGLVISVVTAPVGVSGAVFLLPVQLDLLRVPSPAVTPTNLLFNVTAAPGGLLRYWRRRQLTGRLTRQLIAGTLPGVVLGAVIRVYLVPGPELFRLAAAAVLLPLGAWLCARSVREPSMQPRRLLPPRTVTVLGFLVGIVGGVYGVGGGSLLGPILVGTGLAVATVAPAALAATFLTSIVGAAAYALLALNAAGAVAPDWSLGLACGLGGLVGGSLGARFQPDVPDRGAAASSRQPGGRPCRVLHRAGGSMTDVRGWARPLSPHAVNDWTVCDHHLSCSGRSLLFLAACLGLEAGDREEPTVVGDARGRPEPTGGTRRELGLPSLQRRAYAVHVRHSTLDHLSERRTSPVGAPTDCG